MTIISAIAALSPNLWYRLDETSGTTATNSGSLANNGTYSGSYQNVPGPDQLTTAKRLFSGGQIVSNAGMDVTSPANYSLGMWVAASAEGPLNSPAPILSIGDVSNRLNRGMVIWETHTTLGQPNFVLRWPNSAQVNLVAVEPRTTWKWIVAVFATGTNNYRGYIDGLASAATTLSGTINAVNTDPLLIKSDQPVVVAHVCFWARALTQVEVQSVSNEKGAWPYGDPINVRTTGGGTGGGLTPDQATQLSDIDAKTDDIPGLVAAATYISDTVNSILGWVTDTNEKVTAMVGTLESVGGALETIINDWLTPILNGITATLQGFDETVTRTIGQLFSKSTYDNLTLDNITGGVTCEPIDHDIVGWFHGVVIRIEPLPSRYQPLAPDQDYYIPALATINFTRGFDNWGRISVHTRNEVIHPLPTNIPFIIENVDVLPQPPQSHVRVDWAPGVCGQVFLMRTP